MVYVLVLQARLLSGYLGKTKRIGDYIGGDMDTNKPVNIPDTISNSIEGQKLCDILNSLLMPQVSAIFATAYFNLGGFSLVKGQLSKVKDFKLLLGREPSIQDHFMPSGTETLIHDNLRADTEDVMAHRETPGLVKDFLDLLKKETVEVRPYGPFLHGKAFIIENFPYLGSVAIQGSSNFTAAGLTRQGELNSVLKQAVAVKGIKDWFDVYWNKSGDFKARLIELFSDFTAKYSPFEIYIKALYEYFKDRFQTEVKEEGVSPIFLADFQHDGYMAAKEIVDTYGGGHACRLSRFRKDLPRFTVAGRLRVPQASDGACSLPSPAERYTLGTKVT